MCYRLIAASFLRIGLSEHPITGSSHPTPEAVRGQLQTILASRQFVTATRPKRFLRYIVEQRLAGQTDAIKELVLGIESGQALIS